MVTTEHIISFIYLKCRPWRCSLSVLYILVAELWGVRNVDTGLSHNAALHPLALSARLCLLAMTRKYIHEVHCRHYSSLRRVILFVLCEHRRHLCFAAPEAPRSPPHRALQLNFRVVPSVVILASQRGPPRYLRRGGGCGCGRRIVGGGPSIHDVWGIVFIVFVVPIRGVPSKEAGEEVQDHWF